MIIPAGFAQVNMKFTGADAPRGAQVTYGVDASTVTDPADIAGVVIAEYTAHLRAFQSTGISLGSVLVKVGPNATGPEAEVPAGIPGTAAADAVSPNVAGLATKLTAGGGRKSKGRIFWPGLVETWVNGDGSIDPTAHASLVGAFNDWFDASATDNIPMYLLHTDATAPTILTALLFTTKVATQRRRLRKVGGRRTPPGP